MTKLISVVLLLAGVAMAQSCPVKFERVRAGYTIGDGHYRTHYFTVKWKNTSDKVIVGTKLQAAFLNTLKESEDVWEPWVSDVKIPPNHSQNGMWPDEYFARTHDTKYAKVTLLKVSFADGTAWEDDGSGQCIGTTPDAAQLIH